MTRKPSESTVKLVVFHAMDDGKIIDEAKYFGDLKSAVQYANDRYNALCASMTGTKLTLIARNSKIPQFIIIKEEV